MPSSHLGSCPAPHDPLDGPRPGTSQCTRTGANRRSRSHYVVHEDHPQVYGAGQEHILKVLGSLGSIEARLVRFGPFQVEETHGGKAQSGGHGTGEDLGMVISTRSRVRPGAGHPGHNVSFRAVPPDAATGGAGQRLRMAAQAPELQPEDQRPGRAFVEPPRAQPSERRRDIEPGARGKVPSARGAEGRAGDPARSAPAGGRDGEHGPTLRGGCDRTRSPRLRRVRNSHVPMAPPGAES